MQQHKPNGTIAVVTPHMTHNTTYHTPHNLMFRKPEGSKGYHSGTGQEKQGLPRFIRDYFDVFYVTVCDHVVYSRNEESL